MTRFLADENVPPEVIEMVRQNGTDVTWVKEIAPGVDDDSVLGLAYSEGRVLITFDKDFGDMAFHRGKTSVAGVLLLRPGCAAPHIWPGSSRPSWHSRSPGRVTSVSHERDGCV